MFNFFRKGMGSMLAGLLMAFLIASFALWGIGDPLSTLSSNDVAEIGDETITVNEFANAFELDFRQSQARFGDTFTKDLAVQFGFGNQVISQMADRKAFDVEAKNLGIRVTDIELRNYITGIQTFQDATGTFNKSFYDQTAFSQGYTSSQFEEIMRADLVRGKFLDAMMANIRTPNIAADILTKYTTEERTAEVLTIPATKMTAIGEITDEAILAFYDDNSPLYMAPEYRDISYFEISANKIATTIEISDDAAREIYENRIISYTQEEERGFVQMLLDDMDTANAAIAEIEAGQSFEEVLANRTGDTAEDSTFETEPRSDFVGLYGEDAALALYALSTGEYTEPLETGFGVYIFKLADVTPGSITSFDDIKDGLISALKLEQAVDQLFDVRNTIDDELAAGAPLADIASVIGAEIVKIDNVSIEGIMPDGNASPTLPLIVDFLDISFTRNVGDELILSEGISNKFFMIDVENIYDAILKPLEDVKDQVTIDWTNNRKIELATELSDKIIADFEANAATDLATYQDIESGDYTVNNLTVGRANAENAVAFDIHNSIFSQDVGGIQKIAAADGDGFVIIRVTNRKLTADVDERAMTATKEQIKGALQNDIMAAFTRHLYEALPVVINEKNIQAVLDQLVTPLEQ